MTYRPDESLPEGITVREIVITLLGMALVAVLYLMLTAEPRSPHGDLIEQTDGEPVQVTIQPRCCP